MKSSHPQAYTNSLLRSPKLCVSIFYNKGGKKNESCLPFQKTIIIETLSKRLLNVVFQIQ